MLFNSYIFLFAFLPVTLAGFYALGHCGARRGAGLWLIAASLFFYGWWNPRYLPLIAASVAGNYAFGVWIARAKEQGRTARARGCLTAGVAGNLLLLGYYKYAGFFVTSMDAALGMKWARAGDRAAAGHFIFHVYANRLPGGRVAWGDEGI